MAENNQGLEQPDFLKTNSPSHARKMMRFQRYLAGKALETVGLPASKVPEDWKYTITSTSYQEYDHTLRINSREIIKTWAEKHPDYRPAILELAGYGFVPSGLVEDVRKDNINAFGLALAYEHPADLYTPYASLITGDLVEVAKNKDQSEVIELLRNKLKNAHCSTGAALIHLRPIVGYDFMEKAYIRPGENVDQFYMDMFSTISKTLLAPDGVFSLQVPHKIYNKNEFRNNLQQVLGTEFAVSSVQRSPLRPPWGAWNVGRRITPQLSLPIMNITRRG